MLKAKKKGKTERQRTVRALDDVTRKIVKLRDGYLCQYCGRPAKPRGCHWAHVQGRSDFRLRWSLNNGLCLCYGHHQYFHGHPALFIEWFREKFPARYKYIEEMRKQPRATIRTSELKALLDSHKLKLEELQQENPALMDYHKL